LGVILDEGLTITRVATKPVSGAPPGTKDNSATIRSGGFEGAVRAGGALWTQQALGCGLGPPDLSAGEIFARDLQSV
jgi:hypothetical protein